MAVNLKLTRMLWAWVLPAFCFALVCYFAYFSVYGQHGLLTLARTEAELSVRQTELAALVDEREKLETRVLKMRSDSLDPDLLDEQAREALGYAAPGEITIFDRTK